MADYTKLNLRGVEDAAKKFGMPEGLESRFAREALELDKQGLTLFTLAPDFRIPFGHRHKEQEEVYVVVKGSARVKLEDEIVDLGTWDAVRIPPATRRGLEAGPDGAEVLAVGAPNVGFGDAEQLPDFWPELSPGITLRRMGAYLRAHGVDEWAAYVEALPPEGEEARAFARSQAELGHPDPFKPRTERGRFMRKQLPGFAPNERALAVLVSLEGLREGEETGYASGLVEAAMERAQREKNPLNG